MMNVLRNWYNKNKRPVRVNKSFSTRELSSRIKPSMIPKEGLKITGNFSVRYSLKPHQRTIREFMKRSKRLLAIHGTGSGKTLTAAHIAADFMSVDPTRRLVIFVTPKAVQEQFRSSVSTVLTSNEGIYFTTYQGLTNFLHHLMRSRHKTMSRIVQDAMIIADEAHYIRNGTQNLRVFTTVFKHAKKVLLMTGTPFNTGSASDLIPYAKMLNPFKTVVKVDTSNFEKYFKCKVSVYKVPSTSSNFPRLLGTIRKNFNIPNNKLNEVKVNKSQMINYIKYTRQLQTGGMMNQQNLNKIRSMGWSRNKSLYRTKIFKNQDEPKFQEFLNIFRERPYKTIVFFIQNDNLKHFSEFLKRHNIEHKFVTRDVGNMRKVINDPPNKKIVYLLMPAAKEGLDFKGVRNLIFMDFPWVPSNYDQVVGRARRYMSHIALDPSNRDVQVYDLVYKSEPGSSKVTMNMRAMQILNTKRTAIDSIIENLENISIEKCRLPTTPPKTPPRRNPSPNRLQPRRLRTILPSENYAYAVSPGGTKYHTAQLNVRANRNINKSKRKPQSAPAGITSISENTMGLATILTPRSVRKRRRS